MPSSFFLCPYCRNEVPVDAFVCQYCHRSLPEPPPLDPKEPGNATVRILLEAKAHMYRTVISRRLFRNKIGWAATGSFEGSFEMKDSLGVKSTGQILQGNLQFGIEHDIKQTTDASYQHADEVIYNDGLYTFKSEYYVFQPEDLYIRTALLEITYSLDSIGWDVYKLQNEIKSLVIKWHLKKSNLQEGEIRLAPPVILTEFIGLKSLPAGRYRR